MSVVSNFSEATFVTEKGAEIHVAVFRFSNIFGSHGFNCRAIGQDLRKLKVRPNFSVYFKKELLRLLLGLTNIHLSKPIRKASDIAEQFKLIPSAYVQNL